MRRSVLLLIHRQLFPRRECFGKWVGGKVQVDRWGVWAETSGVLESSRKWIEADKRHAWHPFTRQAEWCDPGHEPVMIASGKGVWLTDTEGRRYLDGNSSIWTNIHGHCREEIVDAIREQAGKLCHSSYLGLGHPLASELAESLCGLFPEKTLERVFFSDNGSTAVEAALKMALQYRVQSGEGERDTFIAFENAYHGDTLGAASLGGVGRFTGGVRPYGFKARHVGILEEIDVEPDRIAAVIIEPLIQGVNEMRPWPAGMLREIREWTRRHGIHLILDEVMTGFGRTGTMFACERDGVVPDFLCLAKGLTGGSLPLAATLTTREIYDAFLGDASRAFYYGHSYTANPLGCAAALASLGVFERDRTLEGLSGKIEFLEGELAGLREAVPQVCEVRQCGLIAGIEFRGVDVERLCVAARGHGLLTRPILNTVVFMPPLVVTREEIREGIGAIRAAVSSPLRH